MSSSGQKSHRPMSTNPKIINPNRTVPNGLSHMRDRATINRLNMYKTRAHYNKRGDFVSGAFMSRTVENPVSRIQPDRRWFGNTRTVGQKELEAFREQMANKINDPYTVVLRQQKLPMALLNDPFQNAKMDLLAVESFNDTFGPKSLRKKARLADNIGDIDSLLHNVEVKVGDYDEQTDMKNDSVVRDDLKDDALQTIFKKGQSKRIWNELYKVIDSSDVLVQVLDVRDPMGTRCKRIEDELRKPDRRHKHMVFVLNKCDLVPTWVTRRWVKILSREYPTLAFHASITNPFGKGSLLQLFRQFSALHSDKKQISIGFVGYPNVGKSSIINTLKGENVCSAAPVPGETRTWRYITLFKRIFLIDCPGVVHPFGNTPTDCVLKNVIRMETITDPADYIGAILARLRPQYVTQHYGVSSWTDPMDFLKQLAKKSGKLLKGGDPDINNTARLVLGDWQLGRLPYFVCPPFEEEREDGFDMSLIGAESHIRKNTRKSAPKATEEEDDEEDMDDEDDKGRYDDGLNSSDSEEDEMDAGTKHRLLKKKAMLKRRKIEKKIRIEVDDQQLVGLPLKSHYSSVDMDEKMFKKAQQDALMVGATTYNGNSTSMYDFTMNAELKESGEANMAAADDATEYDVKFNQESVINSAPLFADTNVPSVVQALFDLTPVSIRKTKLEQTLEKERQLTGKSLVVVKGAKSGLHKGIGTHKKVDDGSSKKKKRKSPTE